MLERPKTAVGPYDYNRTKEFHNDTIVHGYIMSGEDHWFFAVCLDDIVTIYNSYGGQNQLYIKKHKISHANKVLKLLSTPSKKTDFNQISSDFFGYTKFHEKLGIHFHVLRMDEHLFWLPSTSLIIDYLNVLEKYIKYDADKIYIRKARKWLQDNF